MKKKIIYELNALYREPMQVAGYEFGEGEKSVCVVGSMRGNEIQQMFACSRLIERLKQLEAQRAVAEGKSILVIPCINSYSMNIGKRFGPLTTRISTVCFRATVRGRRHSALRRACLRR